MLHLSDILTAPYSGALKTVDNKSTVFNIALEQKKPYKWCYNRALNEENNRQILNFDNDNMSIIFNGLIDNLDKKFIKINFDFRVKLKNGTDFSISNSTVSSTNNHIIVNKKLKLNSPVKKFIFKPYEDVIYVVVTAKDNIHPDNDESIHLKLDKLGFGVVVKS